MHALCMTGGKSRCELHDASSARFHPGNLRTKNLNSLAGPGSTLQYHALEDFAVNPEICECPGCLCELDSTAVRKGEQHFCCEACAEGHGNSDTCRDPECPCADKARRAREKQLDHSLEETFPASDPISP
ncbi:Prokaryotic metallothionein [compost metagenome]